MLLLVTGASGAGKSTARAAVEEALSPLVECAELRDLVDIPPVPTLAWRQRVTEHAVQHALRLQDLGRHLLLSGDPVAAAEVAAAQEWDKPFLTGAARCSRSRRRSCDSRELTPRDSSRNWSSRAPALMMRPCSSRRCNSIHAPGSRSCPRRFTGSKG